MYTYNVGSSGIVYFEYSLHDIQMSFEPHAQILSYNNAGPRPYETV